MTAPTPGAIKAARLHGTTMKRTISIIALAVAALASHAADTPVPAALVMHLPDGTTLTPMLATAHMTKDYKGDTVAVMQWNGINKRAPSINHRIVVTATGCDVRYGTSTWEEHGPAYRYLTFDWTFDGGTSFAGMVANITCAQAMQAAK